MTNDASMTSDLRQRHGRGWWIATLFIVGSSLFALGVGSSRSIVAWTTCANTYTNVDMARVASRKTVSARLSPDVVAALERVSEAEGEPVSRMINRLLRQKLEDLGVMPKRSAMSDQ